MRPGANAHADTDTPTANPTQPTLKRSKRIGNNTMKIRMFAAVSIATAATTLPLAAIAHADPIYYHFQSPSGNIGCDMTDYGNGKGSVWCEVRDHTWVAPPPGGNSSQSGAGFSCSGGPSGTFTNADDFLIDQGQGYAPCPGHYLGQMFMTPSGTQIFSGLMPGVPILDYGHAHTVGAITCDSEPSGVTCTD